MKSYWVSKDSMYEMMSKADHVEGHIDRVEHATLKEQIIHENGWAFDDNDYVECVVDSYCQEELDQEQFELLQTYFDVTGVELKYEEAKNG
jgi:hypothetical protein